MGRSPIADKRCFSQSGLSATFTLRTVTPLYRIQASWFLHLDSDTPVGTVDGKVGHRRTVQSAVVSPVSQIGCQVAGHAIVRSGIDAVGGNIDFENVVALDIIILFGGEYQV